jgi:hypothetical protein
VATKQGWTKRGHEERGSALVEAAFVVPVILLLIAGIVEYGFLFRSASVTSTATRSGARLASAAYPSAGPANQSTVIDSVRQTVEKELTSRHGSDTPVDLWIYKADTAGLPPSGNFSTCSAPCFVYRWDSPAKTFTLVSGSWPAPDVCGNEHDSVGVFVRVQHSAVGFSSIFPSFTVKERTVMRLEPPAPPADPCPGGA